MKLKAMVVVLAVLFSMSATVWAAKVNLSSLARDYTAQDGDVLTDTLEGSSQPYMISIAAGATVTLKNAVINGLNSDLTKWAGITCMGDCNILLDENSENKVKGFNQNYPGIYVPEGFTLTIDGLGSLDVSSNGNATGIGGGRESCGNIVIKGGLITAVGGSYAAGIGSKSYESAGDISITGGTITATGGSNSAGIGSGENSSVGNITISGGSVTATGGYYGAGIGSGKNSSASNITISGGTVSATGGYSGAGIGSGNDKSSVGDITISGGEVLAISVSAAAGIGSGNYSSAGDILISGGVVAATGEYGAAGIGAGEYAEIGDITISNTTTKITATKGKNAPFCIGKGYGRSSTVGKIIIGDDEYSEGLANETLIYGSQFYRVAFYANDMSNRVTYLYLDYGDEARALEKNAFSYEGFIFNGWNTQADGSGTAYADEALVQNLASVGDHVALYAQWKFNGDLSKLKNPYVAQNGDVLTGSLGAYVKVSIADGATVTLDNVKIKGVNNSEYKWAGLTCEGDCNIILADGSVNTVIGFYEDYPGIYVPENKTLKIDGTGSLDASSKGHGAGIGGGWDISCGNIVVNGGVITATGGHSGAGIGAGGNSSAGNIAINGGKITATGGDFGTGIGSSNASVGDISITGGIIIVTGGRRAAGIGGGYYGSSVGNITIEGDDTWILAQKGETAYYSVGGMGTCGVITVYGKETGVIRTNPFSVMDVEFDANGGVGTMDNKKIITGVEPLPPSTYSRAGYAFQGWNTAADCSGSFFRVGADVGLSAINATLYAQWWKVGDVSGLLSDYTAQDGDVLTGELGSNVKISIADGATVKLDGVTINGVRTMGNDKYKWAGLTCEGDCGIVLVDGSVNTVRGFESGYPGIYVPEGNTLTIDGSGSLDASTNGGAAGIGCGDLISCGDIVIKGGTVSATGGTYAAGIGSGHVSSVGKITIEGDNTFVSATKGDEALSSIGLGKNGSCGGVSFFGTEVGSIETSPFTMSLVEFVANGAEGVMSNQINIGSIASLSTNTYTREGYKFLGWNTAVDGSGVHYEDGATDVPFVPNTKLTLYAQWWEIGNLSTLASDYVFQDGDVLKGELAANLKISIADGASVTLNGVTINGDNFFKYKWAGITCEGDCNIVLADGSVNTVRGSYENYPGIYVPEGKTLTIDGSGSLDASSNGYAAGIGGGSDIPCGDIVIKGGMVTATGGKYAAGIGSGENASAGNITISGGTVMATGGIDAVGIGSGLKGTIDNIVIDEGVSRLTAIKNGDALYSIGGSCGSVKIAGIEMGNIETSPFIFAGVAIVKFNPNEGVGTMENQQVLLGYSKLSTNTFTREGYVFLGWNTEPDGSGIYFGDEDNGENLAANTTVTLYAQWASSGSTVDISKLKNDFVVPFNVELKGELGGNYKISIADGVTAVLNGVTINGVNNSKYKWAGLTCEGDCNIVLAEGSVNTVRGFYDDFPGIYVPENKTLTIDGSGSLEASSSGYGAGIGGGKNIPCGNIVINEGEIKAFGGSLATGIGAGSNYSANAGNITIRGGSITATGGSNAAGIGAGYYGSSVGDVTISGGTVTAMGGFEAAGIGSGYGSILGSSVGNITISGGTVIATGGMDAAGVGSGKNNSSVGDITISGGTIIASGGFNGVGIGSGSLYSSVGNISISGGSVTATAGQSKSGIGSGYDNSSVGDIIISGGSVTAIGGSGGSGIGSSVDNSSIVGNITITEGVTKVIAVRGKDDLCSVGSGGENISSVGTVTIGGVVYSNGITQERYVYPPAVHVVDKQAVIDGNYDGMGAFNIAEDTPVDTVIFNREFSNVGKSTLVLPFSIPLNRVDGIHRIMKFDGVDLSKALVYVDYVWCASDVVDENCPSENNGVIDAYMPYIIEMAEGASSLTFHGAVSLEKVPEESRDYRLGDWVFRPVLEYKKWEEDDLELTGCGKNKDQSCVYGFAAGDVSEDVKTEGQFVRVVSGAYIYPLRSYLVYEPELPSGIASANASNVKRMRAEGVALPDSFSVVVRNKNNQTTVIGKFNTRTGEFSFDCGVFDLKGRRVKSSNSARGVFYNKKFIAK